MDVKQSIIEYCKGEGLNVVGFSRCRVYEELKGFFEKRKNEGLENEFEEKDFEKRINPFLCLKEGKTVISIAFPYMHSMVSPKGEYFSKYTHGYDYHKVAEMYLKKLCQHIESLGGNAVYLVDSNALPERYIAYLSGIGFKGKNNLIINERYGSYFFLGEIITDLYIEEDAPKQSLCEECELCIKACPTGSIKCNESNPNICLSYITQKKDIDDEWFDKLGGRIFGCDTCQNVCPFNKKVETSPIQEFTPLDFMENADVKELINIDNKIFKEKYSGTSCGWRGKNVLQRNALVAAVKWKKHDMVDIKKITSPYVIDYYNRLLKYFKL